MLPFPESERESCCYQMAIDWLMAHLQMIGRLGLVRVGDVEGEFEGNN